MMKSLKGLKEPQRTIVELGIILLCAVLIWQSLWFSLSVYLRTEHPVVIVAIDMTPWYVTSMTPTLGAGDILVIQGVDPSTLKPSTRVSAQNGDVIVFPTPVLCSYGMGLEEAELGRRTRSYSPQGCGEGDHRQYHLSAN